MWTFSPSQCVTYMSGNESHYCCCFLTQVVALVKLPGPSPNPNHNHNRNERSSSVSTLQRSVSFVPMPFLLDVRVISGNNGHSNRPWVLSSSSDGDGENDSFNSSLNLGWGTSYGRTTRERHWEAKYALYLIGPRHKEESSNDKKQQSSGEDKDNEYSCQKIGGGRNTDFECKRNRDESTGSMYDATSKDEKQRKCNDNKVVLRDNTAVVEEEGTIDDDRRVACLLSVPFTCSVGDLLEAVSNDRTWIVEEVHTFLDPGEDGYKYCASIRFVDSPTADSFVKAVRGWEWQNVDGSSIKAVLLMEPPRISTASAGPTLVESPDGGQEEQKVNYHQSYYSQKTCNSSIGPSTDTADVLGWGVLMVEKEQDKSNVKCKSEQPNASQLEEKGNNYGHVRELPMCPVCLDCLDPLALGLFPDPTMEEVLEQRNASDMQLENSEVTTSGDFSPPGRRGCCQKRRRQGPGSLCAWSGSTCHVCKILSSMDPGKVRIGGGGAADHQEAQKIFCNDGDCLIAHNLWLCLVCCHVGCGRYTNEHAKSHFSLTGHSYSLELSTGRVWDYYGDRFIHRILRKGLPHYDMEFNTLDGIDESEEVSGGKGERWYSSSLHQQPELLLPHSPSSSSSAERNNNMTVLKNKFARVAHDYEELLASQLQVQTEYYENLIARMIAANAENRVVASETIAARLSDKEEAEVIRLKKDMSCLNERYETAMRSLREAQDEARRLRSDNSEMIRAQHNCKNHIETIMRAVTSSEMKSSRIVAELNRQLQDLNFYLRAQAEVQSSSQREDLEKGRVTTEEEDKLIDEDANFSSSSSSIPHGGESLMPSTYKLSRHHSESSDTIRERLQRRLSEKRRTRNHV